MAGRRSALPGRHWEEGEVVNARGPWRNRNRKPLTLADGVHVSYDRMASFLGSYESAEALKVVRELDAKVEGQLTAAAK